MLFLYYALLKLICDFYVASRNTIYATRKPVSPVGYRWFRGGVVLVRGAGFGRVWRQSGRSCPGIAHLRFGRAGVLGF